MKIIILGAGQVGLSIAKSLVDEHEITIIDTLTSKIQKINIYLDVQTIVGDATSVKVLENANAKDADMLIAATRLDEVNLIACQIAHNVFNVKTKIARVRNQEFINKKQEILSLNHNAIDVMVSPENSIISHLIDLIDLTAASEALNIATGRLRAIVVDIKDNKDIIAHSIEYIYSMLKEKNILIRILAIYRDDEFIEFNMDTQLNQNDQLVFIAESNIVTKFLNYFSQNNKKKSSNIMIIGGGNIGGGMADKLQKDYDLKIIEQNLETCKLLSTKLNKATIINGKAKDINLLKEEKIESSDIICILTNSDEINISTSILTKKLNKNAKIISILKDDNYIDLLKDNGLNKNIWISTSMISMNQIISYISSDFFYRDQKFFNGRLQCLEIKITEEQEKKFKDSLIGDLKFPENSYVCSIIRGFEVILDTYAVALKTDDLLIIMLNNKCDSDSIKDFFK